jgi:2-succinyl-6-hydroxy-2,4-cyclohexadiene-1-carboxylate synthase
MASGLVLLHGFTGSPESWRPVTAGLSDTIRVLMPSLVGHGDHVHADVVGFDDEVDRIASLLSRATRWHLVGYSLGGRIALALLARHAPLFSGATLIGAQPGLRSEDARAERRAADERWCIMLRERPLSEFVGAWEDQPLFRSQRTLPEETLARQRAERLARDPAGLVRSLAVTGLGVMPSYWDALPGIKAPTTLIVGSKDEKFTALGREMAARLPAAMLEIVPDAGHNVVLERPDAVRALIDRALMNEAAP